MVAHHTRDLVHLVAGEAGQDEDPGLIVPDAALVLHLDVVRVDLMLGQRIKRAVVHAALEDATSGIMSEKEFLKILLRASLHMTKNLPTNIRRRIFYIVQDFKKAKKQTKPTQQV